MNTSFINIGDFGLPLFYLAVAFIFLNLLSYMALGFDVILNKSVMKFVFFSAFLLLVISFNHVFFLNIELVSEFKQFFARLMYLLLFLLSYLYLTKNESRVEFVNIWTKRLLKFFILYGLYQYYSETTGLPLFLEFLRNSISYDLTINVQGGWMDSYRVFSVWSEPSFSALPLGLMLYLILFESKSKFEKAIWLMISLAFAYLTFSRLVWLVGIVVLITFLFIKSTELLKLKKIRFLLEKVKYLYVLLFIGLGTYWVFIVPVIMNDFSSFARSSSVIIGINIFLDNFFFGTGFNTYALLESGYAPIVDYYFPSAISHNLFSSYAQQMGILGLIFAIAPVIYCFKLKHVPIIQRYVFVNIFLTICVFGGDLYYLSLFWFLLAYLTAKNTINSRI